MLFVKLINIPTNLTFIVQLSKHFNSVGMNKIGAMTIHKVTLQQNNKVEFNIVA